MCHTSPIIVQVSTKPLLDQAVPFAIMGAYNIAKDLALRHVSQVVQMCVVALAVPGVHMVAATFAIRHARM